MRDLVAQARRLPPETDDATHGEEDVLEDQTHDQKAATTEAWVDA